MDLEYITIKRDVAKVLKINETYDTLPQWKCRAGPLYNATPLKINRFKTYPH
jgi:hypothetical protein